MSIDSPNDRLHKSLSHYRGFVFRWQHYRMLRSDWDHDHCSGCRARFAERPEEWPDTVHTEGFVALMPALNTDESEVASPSPTGHRWIASPKLGGYQLDWFCPECFNACREELGFIVDPEHPQWKAAGL